MSDKKKIDWREFFDRHEGEHVMIVYFGGESSVPIETLYEAVKQRLMSELDLGKKLRKSKS